MVYIRRQHTLWPVCMVWKKGISVFYASQIKPVLNLFTTCHEVLFYIAAGIEISALAHVGWSGLTH